MYLNLPKGCPMHSSIMLPLKNTCGTASRLANPRCCRQRSPPISKYSIGRKEHTMGLSLHFQSTTHLCTSLLLISMATSTQKTPATVVYLACPRFIHQHNFAPPLQCNIKANMGKLCQKLSSSSDLASSTFKDSTSSCSYSERTVDTSSFIGKWVEPCLRGPMQATNSPVIRADGMRFECRTPRSFLLPRLGAALWWAKASAF